MPAITLTAMPELYDCSASGLLAEGFDDRLYLQAQ